MADLGSGPADPADRTVRCSARAGSGPPDRFEARGGGHSGLEPDGRRDALAHVYPNGHGHPGACARDNADARTVIHAGASRDRSVSRHGAPDLHASLRSVEHACADRHPASDACFADGYSRDLLDAHAAAHASRAAHRAGHACTCQDGVARPDSGRCPRAYAGPGPCANRGSDGGADLDAACVGRRERVAFAEQRSADTGD